MACLLIIFYWPLISLFNHLLEPILFGFWHTVLDLRTAEKGWCRRNPGKALLWALKGPFWWTHERVCGQAMFMQSLSCQKRRWRTPSRLVDQWQERWIEALKRRYAEP